MNRKYSPLPECPNEETDAFLQREAPNEWACYLYRSGSSILIGKRRKIYARNCRSTPIPEYVPTLSWTSPISPERSESWKSIS